jgi:NADH-quinone oxidoreductase subunit N
MSSVNLLAMMSLIVLATTTVIVMLTIAIYRHHTLTAVLTCIGLGGCLMALAFMPSGATYRVTELLVFDGFVRFYIGLLLAAGLVTALLCHGFWRAYGGHPEEFYILLLLAVLGSVVIAASSHLASFFLGLEVLSVSLYALIAYPRLEAAGIEAGIKYLVLAAASAAFLVFGMALVYADLGTMELTRFAAVMRPAAGDGTRLLLSVGLAMMLVGIGFKLAVVPFHLWTPDVYQGAPAPVTAFIATVSKGSLVAFLMRLFAHIDPAPAASLSALVVVIAMLSMIVGNLLALRQDNVKRILAYSSIAHLGYLLVAFLAGGAPGSVAVTFYLTTYFVTTLGAFGVITLLSKPQREAQHLDDFRGLFWRHPWLAGVFAAMILSLAGLPLTAGFMGKFYIVVAGVGAARWTLVITLAVTSTIGLYYYLRIVIVMFARRPNTVLPTVTLPLAGALTVAGLTVMLVWLGLLPSPLLEIIRKLIALT